MEVFKYVPRAQQWFTHSVAVLRVQMQLDHAVGSIVMANASSIMRLVLLVMIDHCGLCPAHDKIVFHSQEWHLFLEN